MYIGVDATCWQNDRGYGRHARALLRALVCLYPENHYRFFLDSSENLETLPTQVEATVLRPSVPTALAASANGHRTLADMWYMSRAISGQALDVLLYPTVYSFVPVFSKAKKLVIIHDVIAETYPELTFPGKTARLLWKTKVALGRWQADAVITVSEYSRRALIERFGLNPDRVFVVGEASDPVFRVLDHPRLSPELKALGVDAAQRLVVYVGGFSPHKNLEEMIAAFALLAVQPEFSDLRLVLVGEHRKEVFHSYFREVCTQVEKLGLEDRVIYPGYVPDQDLAALLNISTVLVLPSLMEGFGLPAVEAAACGCPVIATKRSPLPNLLGDGGIYIEPRCNQLEGALEMVLNSESLRRRMRRAGVDAARRLTWEAAAEQLLQIMRKVVLQ
jgi:glycosyltransferase involved in cell wall biosynthesis